LCGKKPLFGNIRAQYWTFGQSPIKEKTPPCAVAIYRTQPNFCIGRIQKKFEEIFRPPLFLSVKREAYLVFGHTAKSIEKVIRREAD
jgi:hypothetical protein